MGRHINCCRTAARAITITRCKVIGRVDQSTTLPRENIHALLSWSIQSISSEHHRSPAHDCMMPMPISIPIPCQQLGADCVFSTFTRRSRSLLATRGGYRLCFAESRHTNGMLPKSPSTVRSDVQTRVSTGNLFVWEPAYAV